MALIQTIMAILAVYRIAQLLPEDDGPFFVFTRIRSYVANRAIEENNELGGWENIDKGINCVYCCGLYAAALVTVMIAFQNTVTNFIIMLFAFAGGQSFLQGIKDK